MGKWKISRVFISLNHLPLGSSVPHPGSPCIMTDVEAPHPPPRRTYGRARAPSSSPDPPTVSETAYISPAKALLNRWSTANTSWKTSLSGLEAAISDESGPSRLEASRSGPSTWRARASLADAQDSQDDGRDADEDDRLEIEGTFPPSVRNDKLDHPHPALTSTQEDEADDEEALKAEMARLRRRARGESSPPQAPPARLIDPRSGLDVPGFGPTTSSSSLTALSSSQRRSSPTSNASKSRLDGVLARKPLASSPESESFPVRASGVARASGRPSRIVQSDDEDTLPQRPSNASNATRMSRSLLSNDDDESLPAIGDVLAAMVQEDRANQTAPPTATLVADPLRLIDEEESEPETPGKRSKVKVIASSEECITGAHGAAIEPERQGGDAQGHGKSETRQVFANVSLAGHSRVERFVQHSRPDVERLPFTHWLVQAANAVSMDSK